MLHLRKVAKDVRALGATAPLRAVYEASKRTGFHSVLFRESQGRSQYTSMPIPFGVHLPTSEEARSRCLDDAAEIISKGSRVFGRRVETGLRASWAMDPLTSQSWPTALPWWKIDIRTDQRLSDVKYVWEAARHRDLVVLARAAVLDPAGPWLHALQAALERWCAECRPERGVNWYSSLELALRAIAWNQVLSLVGDRLPRELRAELDGQLVASARHLVVELPYTLSSMKNNHLLGDGLGLVVLGRMFPTHPRANMWEKVGSAAFMKQLARHMHADGSMIEDSLSYHRFVLEMLAVRVLLGDAPAVVTQAMAAAARHLVDLGVGLGPIPQYGDWDEGRVLADSAPAGSVVGSAYLGLALTGQFVPSSAWAACDELAWYASEPYEAAAPESESIAAPTTWSAGYFRGVRRGEYAVWLKAGSGPSHQHADVGSIWLQKSGQWITQDPGTGTYNGELSIRNGFRTSAAHPVWRPDGLDQLIPHRAFRWTRSVRSGSAEPATFAGTNVLFTCHDAFVSDGAGIVSRVVIVSDDYVVIADNLKQTDGHKWRQTLPLGKNVDASDFFGITEPLSWQGSDEPYRGWHSDTYGSVTPSTWLELSATDAWTVWGTGRPPVMERSGNDVIIGGVRLSASYSPDGATLSMVGDAGTLELVANLD